MDMTIPVTDDKFSHYLKYRAAADLVRVRRSNVRGLEAVLWAADNGLPVDWHRSLEIVRQVDLPAARAELAAAEGHMHRLNHASHQRQGMQVPRHRHRRSR